MKKTLILLLSAAMLAACYEDKSSTRYDAIGEITIEGLEEKYEVISFQDVLSITPAVSSTESSDTFEYLWTIYSNRQTVTDDDDSTVPVDTVGREKTLAYNVELGPGGYTLVLRVTNAQNGYAVYSTATLNVNTPFTTGYYMLKQTADGKTELDFLSPTGNAVEDLLLTMTGSTMDGVPSRLAYLTAYSYADDQTGEFVATQAIVPMSESDMRMLQTSDLYQINDHQTMFYGDEPTERPIMMANDLFSRPFYYSNIGLYKSNQMPATGTYGPGKYGMVISPVTDGMELSVNCVVQESSFTMMYNFFDEKSNSFRWANYNGEWQTMSSDNIINLDSLNQIRRDCLFMGTKGWAVFCDEDDNTSRHLYSLNLSAGRNPVNEVRALDPTLNFVRAQVYGSNKSSGADGGKLYGGVGDKLYMYNTANDTEKLLTPTGMGPGEQITMITHKPGAPEDYLMIGTYKDGKYKVYMYELAAGEPYNAPAVVASGEGKVVDIQYVTTKPSGSYIVNY